MKNNKGGPVNPVKKFRVHHRKLFLMMDTDLIEDQQRVSESFMKSPLLYPVPHLEYQILYCEAETFHL